MDGFVKRFILMGIVYLLAGGILGGIMVLAPAWTGRLAFAHVHLNLLGWMSMLIFGVGYHILPRFAGKVLYSRGLAEVHFWTANAGLLGMAGLSAAGAQVPGTPLFPLFAASAVLEAASLFLFAYNILRTLFVEAPPNAG